MTLQTDSVAVLREHRLQRTAVRHVADCAAFVERLVAEHFWSRFFLVTRGAALRRRDLRAPRLFTVRRVTRGAVHGALGDRVAERLFEVGGGRRVTLRTERRDALERGGRLDAAVLLEVDRVRVALRATESAA